MGVAMLVAAWTGGSTSSYIGSVRAKCLILFLLINQNISIVAVMGTIAATTTAAAITPTMGPAPNESFTVEHVLKQPVESFTLHIVGLAMALLVEVGPDSVNAYMCVENVGY